MRRIGFRGPGKSDFGLLKFDASSIWHGFSDAVVEVVRYLFIHPREGRRLRRNIVRQVAPVNIAIGSGRTVQDGWLGIDLRRGGNVYGCDLRRPFPIGDCTVDSILAEHILEHFPLDDIPGVLLECRRVLKPGSPIRIVCPDPQIAFDLLAGKRDDRLAGQLRFNASGNGWPADVLLPLKVANRILYQFGRHQACLTAESIDTLLRMTGYIGIKHPAPLESAYFSEIPGTHFAKLPDSVDEAIVVEAIRPHDQSRRESLRLPYTISGPQNSRDIARG